MKVEPFRIVLGEDEEQVILYLNGELDLSAIPQLQGVLMPMLHRTDKALVLNLNELTYIDSTGIGVIVSILKARDQLKAPFYIREVPSSIQRLFDLTGISRYMTEGTEAEA